MLEISFIPQLCICMIDSDTDLQRYQFTQVKIEQWRQYQTIQNHFFFKLAVRPRGPPWNWVVLSLQCMEEKRFLLEPIYFDFVVVFLFVLFFVLRGILFKSVFSFICIFLFVFVKGGSLHLEDFPFSLPTASPSSPSPRQWFPVSSWSGRF